VSGKGKREICQIPSEVCNLLEVGTLGQILVFSKALYLKDRTNGGFIMELGSLGNWSPSWGVIRNLRFVAPVGSNWK
jgi:hypothetical protein